MRTLAALTLGLGVGFGALAGTANEARAAGAIVTSSPGASVMTEARLASAGTAMWASISVEGVAPEFVWVLPVAPGARIDLASDAWFDALDEATAPRIVSPTELSSCQTGGVEDRSRLHVPTETPNGLALAPDAESLDAAMASWHIVMTSDMRNRAVAQLATGDLLLLLRFPATDAITTTRTVRIVGDAAAPLPFAMSRAWGNDVPLTAYVIAPERATFDGLALVQVDRASVVWATNTSTYGSMLAAALPEIGGPWLAEAATSTTVFGAESIGNGDEIVSLADAYFGRAPLYGDLASIDAMCQDVADAQRASSAPIPTTCAPGALAIAPAAIAASPCESATFDPTADAGAPTLACDALADDFAIALGGEVPSQTWITRAVSRIPRGTFGSDVNVSSAAGAAIDPLFYAGENLTCDATPSSPGATSSGGSSAQGDFSSGSDTTSAASSAAADTADTAVEACSGDGSGDACGGDTSDDDDSSSCDSSTSDSSGGCSGDSGDAGGEDCSGGGDTGSCHVAHHGRKRSATSRWLLALVAMVAPLRRMTRKKAGDAGK